MDSTSKYGLTSWDDVELSSGRVKKTRDEFIRLDSGSNLVRILTEPHQYLVHKYKEKNDPGFGDKIMVAVRSANLGTAPSADGLLGLSIERLKPTRYWI